MIKRLKNFFQFLQFSSSADKYSGQINKWHAKKKFEHEQLSWPEQNQDLCNELEDTYYQYFIGVNSLLNTQLNTFEQNVINSLEKALKQNYAFAEDIPRLPDVIPRLIHLFRDTNFTWKEVAHEIALDPVFLVGIVKIANSPAYNLQAEADQLEHILVQLGLQEVKKVMMKVALKPILDVEGGYFLKHSGTKIWVHSIKSAEACASLANSYHEEVFNAYLVGLIHNLGQTIIVTKMNDAEDFSVPRSLLFKEQLLDIAKQISLIIAQSWDMDESIIDALNEQRYKNPAEIKSALGQILCEGSAVSKQHILVFENRWQITVDRAEDSTVDKTGNEFEEAYHKLDSIDFS
ncbi:HDOD domain-containing protein [sulfur-oxidizing endosymbiont of Gigantopelta aegis]|uniref:HDOD domain-containing protein n=1 Tax=sulfur-oxidizing endosymbiont of Gigantopelta aegis TaxID=2794934 RepID=UPI001BE3D30F|nr:HDOD domain-containing protein [sulfur-oxidizing endosymbiont of Gigantopelta aegis]